MPDRTAPNVRNPHDLPTKICATCGRPFTWRKKWARDWANVRYCSDRCRRAGSPATPPSPHNTAAPSPQARRPRT